MHVVFESTPSGAALKTARKKGLTQQSQDLPGGNNAMSGNSNEKSVWQIVKERVDQFRRALDAETDEMIFQPRPDEFAYLDYENDFDSADRPNLGPLAPSTHWESFTNRPKRTDNRASQGAISSQ